MAFGKNFGTIFCCALDISFLNSEEEESDIMLKIEFDLILKKYFENSS